MARLLCVVLLLAAVAVADDYTVYNCGVTPSSSDGSNPDDCKVRAKIESGDMGTCIRITQKSIQSVSVEKFECQATGVAKFEKVEDYEVKSRCSKFIDIDPSEKTSTTTTAESKKDPIHSAKLTKSGNTYTLTACSGSCVAEDISTKPCAKYTIDVKKDSCTKSGDIYYKVREVTKGNELYWIELYSASGCEAESIVLQGELLANDKSCTNFSPQTLYSCNAPAYYTTRSCGSVNSCGDCEDLTMPTKALINKCKNTTSSFNPSSTMATCSDGKVSTLTYTSDSCETELKQTSTIESCFFTGDAQYVKLTKQILYICSTPKQCRSASNSVVPSGCIEYPLPFKINTTGDCKLETGERYEYSYKATTAGDNAYRIAVYDSRKCETDLVVQGKFTVEECQMVRPAQKAECSTSSGSLAASALLAVSVMSAVLSMLF